MMKNNIVLTTLLIIIIVFACRKNKIEPGDPEYSESPLLPYKPFDYKNSANDSAAALGRVLFYDKNLSLNNSIACASCHQQEKAFCDNLQFSVGLEDLKTGRNSPSIFAKQGELFWDGRAMNFRDLVLRPVKNHIEMKFENVQALAKKISKLSYYPALFKKAFGSSDIDTNDIKSAMSEFLVNFTFSNNKFNRSLMKKEELSISEAAGKIIFFGKGRCSKCHHIEDPNPGGGIGYGGTPSFVANQANIGLDKIYADRGIGNISQNIDDYGKFMIPVLLNVEYTAPFMHDGRFKTLEEVVEHYNSGINEHANLDANLRDLGALENLSDVEKIQILDLNKNKRIDPSEVLSFPKVKLGLSPSEKTNLINFLKTLSDPTMFTEEKFSNPFKIK